MSRRTGAGARPELGEKRADGADDGRLEGRNPVLEALRAGRPINKLLVAEGSKDGSIREILALARQRRLIIQEVDRKRLDELAGSRAHQGVLAFVAPKPYVEIEALLAGAQARGESPFLLILDELEDPQNFGSILRTAEAAGVHGVVIPRRRAVGLTAAVGKASAGAMEYMPVARVANIAQTLDLLKEKRLWIAGADSSGDRLYYHTDLSGPLALVIGGEGRGLGPLIRSKCDLLVRIPMFGRVSSLNAGVAAALLIYEVVRQRNLKTQV